MYVNNYVMMILCNSSYFKILIYISIFQLQGQPMVIQSSANVSINARDENGKTVSQFFLGNDEIVAKQKIFRVDDNNGNELLYADKDVIRFGRNQLRFGGMYMHTLYIILYTCMYVHIAIF